MELAFGSLPAVSSFHPNLLLEKLMKAMATYRGGLTRDTRDGDPQMLSYLALIQKPN